MTHPLLAIDNLSIAFRQQGETQTVVHNLSLEVAVGETLALVGESGSGKSISALSVLRLLPTPPASYPSGDIRFHGQSLLHADEATLRGVRGNRIAMIFQEPMVSLNPLHTLEKQLYEVLSLHRGMRKEAARGEILDCLERVGIRQAPRRLADYPHQLSGGQRQRVMIAMALLTRPELLIADEPTTALDVSVQAQILQLLRELKQELNMGLLFITHNLSIVRQLADRVAVMQNGRCVEHNHCRALFSAPEAAKEASGGFRLGAVPGDPRRRQDHADTGAGAHLAGDLQGAAMQLDQRAGNGQPQAGALPRPLPIESLEQSLALFLRHPGATVLHAEQQTAVLIHQAELDTATFRGVLQGIADQVLQENTQARRIATQLEIARFIQLQSQLLITLQRQRNQLGQLLTQKSREIKGLHGQLHGIGF